MNKKEYFILFLAFVFFILFILIFKWINYLTDNNYLTSMNCNCQKCDICRNRNRNNRVYKREEREGFSQVNLSNNTNSLSHSYGLYPFTQWLPSWMREKLYGIFPTFPNIIEGLYDRGTSDTSHTVDLPLNNPIGCKNMCINARCSSTGQQCLADIDCPGCNPYNNHSSPKISPSNIIGDNDSGKLTAGITPNYSSLTTDIGTMASIFDKNNLDKGPVQADFGTNSWRYSSDFSQNLYDKRYRPKSGQFAFKMDYSDRPSITGMFSNDGPLPSNYT
jgi:hypothetical protein